MGFSFHVFHSIQLVMPSSDLRDQALSLACTLFQLKVMSGILSSIMWAWPSTTSCQFLQKWWTQNLKLQLWSPVWGAGKVLSHLCALYSPYSRCPVNEYSPSNPLLMDALNLTYAYSKWVKNTRVLDSGNPRHWCFHSQNSRQTPSPCRWMRQKDDLKIYSASTLFRLSYSDAFYGLFLSPDTALLLIAWQLLGSPHLWTSRLCLAVTSRVPRRWVNSCIKLDSARQELGTLEILSLLIAHNQLCGVDWRICVLVLFFHICMF